MYCTVDREPMPLCPRAVAVSSNRSVCLSTFQGYVGHGIGIFVFLVSVPKLPNCRVPVLRSYQTYRSVGYPY